MDEEDNPSIKFQRQRRKTDGEECSSCGNIWLAVIGLTTLGIFIILLIFSIITLNSIWTVKTEIQKVADFKLAERFNVLLKKIEDQVVPEMLQKVKDFGLVDRFHTLLTTFEKKIMPAMEMFSNNLLPPPSPPTPATQKNQTQN